jgi:hypothetical protein
MFVALAVVLAGCGSAERAAAGGPVPWLNQPRPRYEIPPPQVVRYTTNAPPCRAADLRVTRGHNGAATGNLLEELVFTNTGPTACLLRGYPIVTADTPTGRRVLHPRRGTFFGELVPADLEPSGHVFLDFGTSDCGCRCESGGGVRYRHLVFTLPQGGAVHAGGITITNGCRLDMSAFGLPERVAPPPAKPGTPGTLQATARMPATARAGATLRYVVTLANPSGVNVVLSSCPAYTQYVGNEGGGAESSFALNCSAIDEIPANGRVEYEMKLEVPAKLLSGPAKVAWHLNTPTGPYTGGVVRIVGG